MFRKCYLHAGRENSILTSTYHAPTVISAVVYGILTSTYDASIVFTWAPNIVSAVVNGIVTSTYDAPILFSWAPNNFRSSWSLEMVYVEIKNYASMPLILSFY